jgi:hypothetical protein
VQLLSDEDSRRIANGTTLELHDAVLIEDGGKRKTYLGTIAPGVQVEVHAASADDKKLADNAGTKNWLDPAPFLLPLREYQWPGAEDQGEIRLVAWAAGVLPGEKVEPKVDRHRGLTLVVAHLAFGSPPSPDEQPYSSYKAGGPSRAAAEAPVEPLAGNGQVRVWDVQGRSVMTSRNFRASPVSSIQAPPAQETSRP